MPEFQLSHKSNEYIQRAEYLLVYFSKFTPSLYISGFSTLTLHTHFNNQFGYFDSFCDRCFRRLVPRISVQKVSAVHNVVR